MPLFAFLLVLIASSALSLPAHNSDEEAERRPSHYSALVPAPDEGVRRSGHEAEDSWAQASSLSDVELVAGEDEEAEDDEDDEDEDEDEEEEGWGGGDARTGSQHLFASFAPLFSNPSLAHSRAHSPYDTESTSSRSYDTPFRFRSSSYTGAEERVLGSGNFGVIKGGTYYAAAGDQSDDVDPSFFRGGNNGHGRPPYLRGNPQPAYRHGGDFFAGFRDFADITTPAKPAYSQYFVVYANSNSTAPRTHAAPHNIIEQLALLDAPPKTSKNKSKLVLYKEKQSRVDASKKNRWPKEPYEPLLALS